MQQPLQAGEQVVVLVQLERRAVDGGILDGGADLEDDAARVMHETEVVPAFFAEAVLDQDLDVARDDAGELKSWLLKDNQQLMSEVNNLRKGTKTASRRH